MIVVVYYKLSVDKDTQVTRYKAVEQHGDEKLKHIRKDEVQLLDEYVGYRD